MCLQKVTTCSECGKDSDGLMTCTYVDGEEIRLCPDCLKADGSFCLSCGQFCAGMTNFDFVHPGYCDNCWDEIEADNWDDEDDDYDEQDFHNGSLDY